MIDYTVKEAYEIIKSLENHSQVHMTKHFHTSNFLRHKNLDLCMDALFNQEIMGIQKQDFNKFKLSYEHKIRKSQDLYLIIVINDNKDINLITTYDGNKRRRLGENEGR